MVRQLIRTNDWDVELVAVNDIAPYEDIAYLIEFDSVHRHLDVPVQCENDRLRLGDREVLMLREADPARLPWKALDVDVVIDSTGRFTARDDAKKHLTAGAHRVLIGAPSPDADCTLVCGVNEHDFDPGRHHVVSNASCTTNSLAPSLKVLDDAFGIESVLATTVHAYTASQSVVDIPAAKPHRGRAAALNMIPTTTGADRATVLVLPQLEGRLRAMAIRVPVPDGSLTDISVCLKRPISAGIVNTVLREAAEGTMRGVLGFETREIVSSDVLGNTCSGIIHARATATTGQLAKVLVWYDNEYGYAARCLDVVSLPHF